MRGWIWGILFVAACHHAPTQGDNGGPDGTVVGDGDLATPPDLGNAPEEQQDLASTNPLPGADLASADLAGGSNPLPSDGDWEWLNPRPTGENLSAVWSDGTQVWAVGWRGTVVRSDDGVSFALGRSGTHAQLNAVWGNGSLVYVVGEKGTLLRSTDGGRNFAAVDSGVTTNLNGVWGSGSDVFVVGDSAVILRGSGTSFAPQTAPTSTGSLNAIWGRSTSDIFIGGQWGQIHHTSDGTNWSNVATSGNDVTGVSGDAQNVWFSGDGGWGGYTHFDGTHWVNRDMNPGVAESWYAVWGAAANDVYIVGDNGTLAHSDSDFSSYSRNKLVDTPWALRGIWGKGDTVYVVGYGGILLRSIDHAKTFQTLLSGKQGWDQSHQTIWASDENHLFVGGASGHVWRSGDAGENWAPLTTGLTTVASIAGRSDGTLLVSGGAVGLSGLLRSTDWGDHFTTLTMKPILHEMFVRGDEVFGVDGGSCVVHHSPDLGTTINDITLSGQSCYPEAIFGVGSLVVVGGPNQPTFYSADGKTFKQATVEGNNSIQNFWGSDVNDLYGVGFYGLVVHSSDGGATWQKKPTPTTMADGHLSVVSGRSADEVYAIGDSGLVLRTRDHGASWDRLPSAPFVTVGWAGPSHLFIAGTVGAILRWTY
jgi:photosystem II stability/assembly factor-like uncharacterized protein